MEFVRNIKLVINSKNNIHNSILLILDCLINKINTTIYNNIVDIVKVIIDIIIKNFSLFVMLWSPNLSNH